MDLVNADKVKWLQNQGIYVAIYTVRSDAQLARVRAMKPDAIITDIRI
jgi:glycerophosphoryl diester phosphodiesterase